MKNILITGGAGFIGSHLTESLLKRGNKVLIIDNFNDYYDPAIKRRNVEEIKETFKIENIDIANFKLYEGDIRDKELINRVFDEKIDIIVHLAAMAGVRYSIEQPELYYDVNINGTLNLLEKCRERAIKKFVFASSSSVYGNNEKVPFSEEDNVDFPISPYAATKKSGELLLHTYYHLHGISAACLRFFTVYGPRQRPDLAIHKFTKLILDGVPLPFYGDGTTQRDYTYIEDIIDGVLKAISWVDSSEKRYGIFNLGESNTISLTGMVSTIEHALGLKAELERLPAQLGDVDRTFADISKSKSILGYNPLTVFADGVGRFVEWYKKNRY